MRFTGKGIRAAGRGTGTVLVLVALAGCSIGGEDGKGTAQAAGTPSASAEPTHGTGDYRPPTDLCSNVDFGPLTAAVAPRAGSPKGEKTGSDPATASGAACLQGFKTAGTKTDGRSIVYCSAWKNVAIAIKQHSYRLSSARREAKGPVVPVPGLGRAAFRYENVKDSAPFATDLRLMVRDSNLECEVQVQSLNLLTGQQIKAAWPAMAETARALLPKLRP